MKKIASFAVNALLVVTCVLTCVNISKNWFSKSTPNRPAVAQPPAGTKLEVPEQDWAKAPATLVLVVSPACHACEDSVPLYRKLIPAATAAGVGLVAISPGPEEATRQWLSDSGLVIPEVHQLGALGHPFVYLPTVTLVNNRGVVEQSWVGSGASAREKEIIASISRARKGASGT